MYDKRHDDKTDRILLTAALLILVVLFISTVTSCCSQEPLEPQPTNNLREAVVTNFYNWLDRRIDETNHKAFAQRPWLSCETLICLTDEFALLADELDEPDEYWDFNDFVDSLRAMAIYRAEPPNENILVLWLKEAVELFDPEYIREGLE